MTLGCVDPVPFLQEQNFWKIEGFKVFQPEQQGMAVSTYQRGEGQPAGLGWFGSACAFCLTTLSYRNGVYCPFTTSLA